MCGFLISSPYFFPLMQICPGLNANEMHALYNKHHKVSSLLKARLNTHNSVKYEVVCTYHAAKQYLRSILDISVFPRGL